MRVWRLARAGSGPNPSTLTQRARTFSAAAGQVGSATLLTVRAEGGLAHYVALPDRDGADQAAVHLAQTVAATAAPEPGGMPVLTAPVVGWLRARSSSVAVRDTQVGADPAELVRRLSVAMRNGSWVAAVCRRPTRSEWKRGRRWHEHRLGPLPQHHSSDDQAMVVSFWAGAGTVDEFRSLLTQVAAALPGFDIDAVPHAPSLAGAAVPWTLGSLALWGGALAAGVPEFAAAAAGVPAGLVGAGVAARWLPSKVRRVDLAAAAGVLPLPPRRHTRPQAPREEVTPTAVRQGQVARDGSYPLAPASFLVGPSVFVGLVAPHAGGASGAAGTEHRSAAAALLDPIGPVVGTDSDDHPVHIPAAGMWEGVGVCGIPGYGKSQLVRALYGWHCYERIRPRGEAGWPGSLNALVAFESKGEDLAAWEKWAHLAGDEVLTVEVADRSPGAWGIDLFAVPGSHADKAAFFVNAMIYAFGEDAIQSASFEALTGVFTAALAVDDVIAREAGLPAGKSPLWYAHVLLGGTGDPAGVQLAEAINRVANTVPRDGDGIGSAVELAARQEALTAAAARLAPWYAPNVTPSQRRTQMAAPRNKVSQLLEAEHWWAPDRPKVPWDAVLDEHRAIVINTGQSRGGEIVNKRLSAAMSALLLFGLHNAIERRCSGWERKGRSVTVFADELGLVAGASPEIVTWMRNTGRSYGVRPVFATQYPEQLDRAVRTAFMSFSTFFWFTQSADVIANEAARDLSLGGDQWNAAEIANLEKFVAVLRTSVGGRRQPPVSVRVTHWEDQLDRFADAQGWTHA